MRFIVIVLMTVCKTWLLCLCTVLQCCVCMVQCLPLQDPSAMPRPTSQDLAGFWDLLQLSIEDVSAKFQELQQIRGNEWKPLESPDKKVWNAYTQTCAHTHIQTHKYTLIHRYRCTFTNTYACIITNHSCTHKYSESCTHDENHTHTNTHIL